MKNFEYNPIFSYNVDAINIWFLIYFLKSQKAITNPILFI